MPQALLTDQALTKIRSAAGDASAVAISHVALGDGLGITYDPDGNQVSLRRELARLPIESRVQLGARSWQVKAEFPSETPAFTVREMGFFDADNTLIAIWAGQDIAPRQTGAIAYLIEHVLNFSRVGDGLIIVEAPEDTAFQHAVLNLETHAIIAREQFAQRLDIRALQHTTGA